MLAAEVVAYQLFLLYMNFCERAKIIFMGRFCKLLDCNLKPCMERVRIIAFIWQPVGSCFLILVLMAFFLNVEVVAMVILNCLLLVSDVF